jgi:hypothetical protein
MSTADLTALDSQRKYALHYNCIRIRFLSPIKLTQCHDITEIFLKVALNTTSLPTMQNGKECTYIKKYLPCFGQMGHVTQRIGLFVHV